MTTGLARDECICSVNCTENCKGMNQPDEVSLGLKYCPGPRYSTKSNNIFKLDDNRNTDILLAQNMSHVEQDRMVLGDVDIYVRRG